MSEKTITINVSGAAKSGKSTIAFLLADFLNHSGFDDVNVNLLDYDDSSAIEDTFMDKLSTITTNGTKIVVNEVLQPLSIGV
jgi:uridine kinase